jgi:hypothetical protein
MKKVAKAEGETIVSIPSIVRMTVVAIEPQVIVIVFHLEDVEVAIRIGNV